MTQLLHANVAVHVLSLRQGLFDHGSTLTLLHLKLKSRSCDVFFPLTLSLVATTLQGANPYQGTLEDDAHFPFLRCDILYIFTYMNRLVCYPHEPFQFPFIPRLHCWGLGVEGVPAWVDSMAKSIKERRPVESLEIGHCANGHICKLPLDGKLKGFMWFETCDDMLGWLKYGETDHDLKKAGSQPPIEWMVPEDLFPKSW